MFNFSLGLVLLSLIPWAITVWHLVRTQRLAKSSASQAGWLLIVIFMPALGIIFYWLIEGPRRRSSPPPAVSG